MSNQLILQFPAESLVDFDALVALDDALIENLESGAQVDGYDFGSGQVNVFIFTDEPLRTFESAMQVMVKAGCLERATAAYRLTAGCDYTVVWPKDSQRRFAIL